MVKRKRSAKQKANDKRLGRMAKARARPTKRKTTTRKRRTTKRKMKTLSGRPAYPRKRKAKKSSGWNW
jgi:hypothetical protein